MYEYTPKKENQKAAHLILLTLIGGFLLLALTTMLPTLPFRWVVQLIGIGFIGVGIFFYTRYFTRTFTYSIVEREDGTLDFCVTECQRKSRITVCRISLASVEEVVLLPPDDGEKKKAFQKKLPAEGRKVYSYTVNLAPTALVCLLATECGQPLAIYIESNETLLEILKKR